MKKIKKKKMKKENTKEEEEEKKKDEAEEEKEEKKMKKDKKKKKEEEEKKKKKEEEEEKKKDEAEEEEEKEEKKMKKEKKKKEKEKKKSACLFFSSLVLLSLSSCESLSRSVALTGGDQLGVVAIGNQDVELEGSEEGHSLHRCNNTTPGPRGSEFTTGLRPLAALFFTWKLQKGVCLPESRLTANVRRYGFFPDYLENKSHVLFSLLLTNGPRGANDLKRATKGGSIRQQSPLSL